MKIKVTITFVSIFLLLITLFFFPVKSALVFYKEKTSNIVALLPLTTGDQFDIIFTHSIHLTDVVEKYRVTEDMMIEQYEIVFESYGIGMPSSVEEGQTFESKNGKYHLGNLNYKFDSINIRNGKTVSEHRLRWSYKNEVDEEIVWFNDYFEPGAWYTVTVEKLPLWKYLKGVKIGERSK